MTKNLTGSCLCGSVKYSLHTEPQMVLNCHCSTCKKNTGAVFETILVVDEAGFQINEGEELLTCFEISRKARKHFCSQCGTPIYNRHRLARGKAIVHLGSLDEPTAVTPSVNLHAAGMLKWVPSLGEMRTCDKGFQR